MQEVEFIVEVLPEEAPVRGNAITSNDADFDREVEDDILADLADGNVWAWCAVKVTARIDGIECSECRGRCRYTGEQEFREDAMYSNLKLWALEDLRDELSGSVGIVKRTIREECDG